MSSQTWLPQWIQLEFLVSATPSWYLFLFPAKVSGQHIPEGIHKKTRVTVTTSWHSCLVSMDSFSHVLFLALVYCPPSSCKNFHKAQHDTKERFKYLQRTLQRWEVTLFHDVQNLLKCITRPYLHFWIYLKNLAIHIYNFTCNHYLHK